MAEREYRIQAPDGSILRIVGPDNATPDELRSAAERAFASKTRQAPAPVAAQPAAAQPEAVAPVTGDVRRETRISPEVQAARDQDAIQILRQEEAAIASRAAAGDPRAQADLGAVQRQIASMQGAPAPARAGGIQPSMATSRGVRSDVPTAAAEAPAAQQAAPAVQQEALVQQPGGQTTAAAPDLTYEQTFGIRPTTPAGVAGAVTRGSAPIAAGAALGAMTPVPGGAAIGAGTMALAPVVLDPAVQAFNRVFGTNVSTVSEALQNLMTKLGVAMPETQIERGVEAGTRGVAAGVAAPAGVARGVQLAVPAGSTASRVSEAVRVGGMGPTGAGGITGLTGAGVRGGAAATAGGIGGFAAEPTTAGALTGAAFGAATPAAGAVAKSVLLGVWNSTIGRLFQPTQTAEQALLNVLSPDATAAQQIERGREAISAITQGMPPRAGIAGQVGTPVTPGYQRNLVEILDAGGVKPTVDLAVLASRLENAGGDVADKVLKFQQNQVSALRQQLLQINDQLRVPMLTPGRKAELTQVRDNILARVDAEEAVANAAQRATTELAAGVQAPGQTIAQRAAELSEGLRSTLVRPAYTQALDSARGATTDVGGLIADAERVLGRPLSEFSPETAPAVARAIMDMAPQTRRVPPPPAGGETISARLARRTSGQAEGGPAVATLQQLDDLRKAINSDIAAARRGTGNLSGVTTANLQSLHSSVDRMVRQSTTFSDETKGLYDKALENYRNIYAPRFREGVTAEILKPAMFGRMRIEPSQVVGSFLKDADAADQFVRTFAGDPVAFSALRDGIVETARNASLDGFALSPKKLEGWLASNAPILRRYEEAGMNVRGALYQMERDANAKKAVFDRLQAQRGPFAGKEPDDILRYVTSDPARMRLALNSSDDIGKDTIRRVVAEQLNQALESNPQAALKTLTDETTRAAYRQALPASLINDAVDRAKMGIAAKAALADPLLAKSGAADAVITRSNLTTPQLQALLQVAESDIARIKRIDQTATRGGAEPRVGMITRQVAEAGAPAAAVTPNSSMSAAMNAIVRTFSNIEQRVNRKVNAELARVIYENPESAMVSIQNAIARAEKRARPAGMTRRAAPAAAGAVGGMIGEQVRQQYQMEPTP